MYIKMYSAHFPWNIVTSVVRVVTKILHHSFREMASKGEAIKSEKGFKGFI